MIQYNVLETLETSLGKLKIEEIIESNPLGEGQLRISLIRSTGKEYEIATVAHVADEDVLEVYPSDEEWDLVETIGYWSGLVERITGKNVYELEIKNLLDK